MVIGSSFSDDELNFFLSFSLLLCRFSFKMQKSGSGIGLFAHRFRISSRDTRSFVSLSFDGLGASIEVNASMNCAANLTLG